MHNTNKDKFNGISNGIITLRADVHSGLVTLSHMIEEKIEHTVNKIINQNNQDRKDFTTTGQNQETGSSSGKWARHKSPIEGAGNTPCTTGNGPDAERSQAPPSRLQTSWVDRLQRPMATVSPDRLARAH